MTVPDLMGWDDGIDDGFLFAAPVATIQLNHSDKIFNFHAVSLAQPHLDTQPETT